jgi:oligo-1,6-glucosidase
VLDHYDCFTVAEAPLVTPKQALTYVDEEKGQVDIMIQFQCQCADCLFTDYIPTKFNLRKMKRAFSNWQYKLQGRAWNALYIENHDHPRMVSRYGSEKFWKESAKMLAAMYLFQQGTPFVYQGQELGMTNWKPKSIDEYRDVQTIWNYNHSALNKTPQQRLERQWRSARDNARTPVQWTDGKNAGFTEADTPWMNVNPNYNNPEMAVLNTLKIAVSGYGVQTVGFADCYDAMVGAFGQKAGDPFFFN